MVTYLCITIYIYIYVYIYIFIYIYIHTYKQNMKSMVAERLGEGMGFFAGAVSK